MVKYTILKGVYLVESEFKIWILRQKSDFFYLFYLFVKIYRFNWRPIKSCCTWKHIFNLLICLSINHSMCLCSNLCVLGYFTNYSIIVLLKMFLYFSLFCNDFAVRMIFVYLRNLSVHLLWHNEISFPLGLIYLDCMWTHVLSIHLILNSGICSEWDRTISKTDIAV